MSKCVPSSSAIVWSIRSWFHCRNSSTPSTVRLASWSRWSATATTDSPGRMRAATSRMRLLDPVQLLPAPRVGLVEVELDAAERAGEQRVALAPDGIARIGLRRVLVAEEARELARTRRSRPRPCARARRAASGRRCGRATSAGEERRGTGVFAAPGRGLLRAAERLAARRRADPRAIPSRSAVSKLASDSGTRARRWRRDFPVVLGVVRHEVEAAADRPAPGSR